MYNQPLDEFFDSSLTVEAVYQPGGGSPRSIEIIFERPAVPVSAGGVRVQSAEARALCRDVDVADADNTATLTVKGEQFRVVQVERGGGRIVGLVLVKADAAPPVFFEQGPVDEFMDQELLDEAIIRTESGVEKYILTHFSREYAVDEAGGVSLMSTTPTALCRTKEIENINTKWTVTIGGDTWRIANIEHDGTGFTRLILTR
jgi:hypothetical protein